MEQLFDLSLINSAIRMVTPILLAALGGAVCARAGLFNIALEGLVLVGAFSAIVGNTFLGNVLYGVLFAVLVTILFSLIFGYLSVDLKANAIIVGIAMNFLALGLTTFALRTIYGVKGAYYDKDMKGLPEWEIPLVDGIPVLGSVFSGHSPVVYLAFLLVIVFQIFFFKTVWGFRLLAVGINPAAAKSMGIGVRRIQYMAVILSGVLCGLAGAQLSLGQVTMFAEGMTAGRGFIALVAMMFGQSNPLGVMGASFLFGFMDALSIRLQGFSIPTHFTLMLPYVMTLVAMFFFKDQAYIQATQTGSARAGR